MKGINASDAKKSRKKRAKIILTTALLVSGALTVAMILAVLLFRSGGSHAIILSDGLALDEEVCAEKGIMDQVTVIHSTGCPACRLTLPQLQEAETETGYKFEYIDIDADRERLSELGMLPQFIPTYIIRCTVHVGYATKDQIKALILG